MAEMINENTPMRIDQETELMNAVGINGILTYNNRLMNYIYSESDVRELRRVIDEELKLDAIRQACTTPDIADDVLGHGFTMRYVYYDQNRSYLTSFEIIPADCGIFN